MTNSNNNNPSTIALAHGVGKVMGELQQTLTKQNAVAIRRLRDEMTGELAIIRERDRKRGRELRDEMIGELALLRAQVKALQQEQDREPVDLPKLKLIGGRQHG